MKAITLWQPYASFMVAVPNPPKTIETRPRGTSHRGPLVIHAAKQEPPEILEHFANDPFLSSLFTSYFCPAECPTSCTGARDLWRTLPRGKILGSVVLQGIQVIREGWELPTIAERALGDYTAGRLAYFTNEPARLVHPIPWKGQQGLWELSPDVFKGASYV